MSLVALLVKVTYTVEVLKLYDQFWEAFDMESGIVEWFSAQKGYGFIAYGDEKEIFVHYTAIQSDAFKVLGTGQNVTFEIKEGSRGLQAANVSIVTN